MPDTLLRAQHFTARGPLSQELIATLQGGFGGADHFSLACQLVTECEDVINDDDVQCSLFVLYASFYGSVDSFRPELEWNVDLLHTRQVLEDAFERELRLRVEQPMMLHEQRANDTHRGTRDGGSASSGPGTPRTSDEPAPFTAADVARTLFALTEADTGPSLARYFARHATESQAREFLMHKSVYTLREADPHSWAIPRLTGGPKAALVEIQSDEYGGGRRDRVHAELYARALTGAGLSAQYGAYFDRVPAITLASQNQMSMFGLNRRLLGAVVGHLAAFEMTSSIPNRQYADGFRRLGMGIDVTEYFDEHVEADAVHEQIAAHNLAGQLAVDQPDLLADILFGAAACLTIDGWMAQHIRTSWEREESSLRRTAVMA